MSHIKRKDKGGVMVHHFHVLRSTFGVSCVRLRVPLVFHVLLFLTVSIVMSHCATAAEMSASHVFLRPNGVGTIQVMGSIEGESTFGWNILLEVTPREGSRGQVRFTSAEKITHGRRTTYQIRQPIGRSSMIELRREINATEDITQHDDVWPGAGTFSPFDTSRTDSVMLNGAVDDNGSFVASPITFAGLLAEFPIVASPGASGIWDVKLFASAGRSHWEGVNTRLIHGVITVSPKACNNDVQCRDGNRCTVDRCEHGVCSHEVDLLTCPEIGDKYRTGSRKGRKSPGRH